MINLRFKLLVFCIISIGCNTLTQEQNKKTPLEDPKFKLEVESRDSEIDFLFNNENIDYAIFLAPDRSEFPIISYYGVDIEGMTNYQELELRSISSSDWLSLLDNEKTDWAANIVLYYLYERDAFELSKYEDPNRWRKFMKNRDIEYWKTIFSNESDNIPKKGNVLKELVE